MITARSLEQIARPAERLDADERGALAQALGANLAPLSPHVAVLDAARALAEPGTFAVVTGQQPGLLGGPLYSLIKALQAARLAASLRKAWNRPVVALFWNHADDHDVAEAHHAWLVNANLDLQKVGLAGLSSGRQPLSKIVLDDATHRLPALGALLAQLYRDMPCGARALEALLPRSGESLARHFTRALLGLAGPRGLVVLEPDWIRPAASAALGSIVAADPVPALVAGSGAEPPIDSRTAALLFHHETDRRRALRPGGDGFRYDGEEGSRTCSELAAEIAQEPASWSAGALLRPLVQDLCLPVAAYVGGAGEQAYHAQLGELRKRAGAPDTPFVPRVSVTLVDPECRVSLAKLGVSVEEVLDARGEFPGGAGESSPLVERVKEVGAQAAAGIEALRREIVEFDPSLLSQAQRAGKHARDAIEKLAEKIERVQQNRSGKGRRHQRRLASWLAPRGELQERVLGPLPFLARFGEDWLAAMHDALDPFRGGHEGRRGHLVLEVGEDASAEPEA